MGSAKLSNFYDEDCIYEEAEAHGFFIARNTLNRFLNDKAFYVDEDYIVITEGVMTNKNELFAQYGIFDLARLAIHLYEMDGTEFFAGFRGSFSGALFDAKQRRWIIYTNQSGDESIFYHEGAKGRFCFGSQVNYILSVLESNQVKITLDNNAVLSMLTYGFMYDAFTYAEEVTRLLPGHYALIGESGIRTQRYFDIKGSSYHLEDMSETELIDHLDALFRSAVIREYSIDEEYGLSHIADLSGGLDSRMVNWVARDLGFTGTLNLCYSQQGYEDELIATQIASTLGNDMVFKPMNHPGFLLRPERIINMNYGLGLYSGITAGEELLHALNMPLYGIEHTGQLGDVIIGSFEKNSEDDRHLGHSEMYSALLSDKLPAFDFRGLADPEARKITVRGFLGAQSSHFIRKNYTEVLSPFTDVDFMGFCVSIPIKMRADHELYKRWILTKYPNAAQFTWEKEGVPVSSSRPMRTFKHLQRGAQHALSRLLPNAFDQRSMNPFNLWLRTVPGLKESIDSIFRKYASTLENKTARKLSEELFGKGSLIEKTMAITAVMACRYYSHYGHDWELA